MECDDIQLLFEDKELNDFPAQFCNCSGFKKIYSTLVTNWKSIILKVTSLPVIILFEVMIKYLLIMFSFEKFLIPIKIILVG